MLIDHLRKNCTVKHDPNHISCFLNIPRLILVSDTASISNISMMNQLFSSKFAAFNSELKSEY